MTEQDQLSLKERASKFVGSLHSLARQEERGTLAALRRGLGQPPGAVPQMYPYVAPFLTVWESGKGFQQTGQWFYVVAALFALHSKENEGGLPFGQCLARLKSDSMDLRLTALLGAHPNELPDQLRRMVSLLKANDITINWFALLDDLLHWTLTDRPVQRRWAHSYYASNAKETA